MPQGIPTAIASNGPRQDEGVRLDAVRLLEPLAGGFIRPRLMAKLALRCCCTHGIVAALRRGDVDDLTICCGLGCAAAAGCAVFAYVAGRRQLPRAGGHRRHARQHMVSESQQG